MVLQDVGSDSEFQPARIGEGHALAGSIDVFALEVGSSRLLGGHESSEADMTAMMHGGRLSPQHGSRP